MIPSIRRRCMPGATMWAGLTLLFSHEASAKRELVVDKFAHRMPRPTYSDCRCEYPGEDFYGEISAATLLQEDYIIMNDELILPSDHTACQGVTFVCPGDAFDGPEWSYECPSPDDEGSRRRAKLRGHRSLVAYKKSFDVEATGREMTEQALNIFEKLRAEEAVPVSYVILPSDNTMCGGTADTTPALTVVNTTAATVLALNCTETEINFDKGGDGRFLGGGIYLTSEWFHSHGMKVTARNHLEGERLRPMLFDTSEPSANGVDNPDILSLGSPNAACSAGGVGVGRGGQPGQAGENCEPARNVLIPNKKSGFSPDSPDYGYLDFDFSYEIEMFYDIGFMNILGEGNMVEVFTKGGGVQRLAVGAVGRNGVQTLSLNLTNVEKIVIGFESFSAITNLRFCMKVPKA